MKSRRGLAALWRMTPGEYRANIDGLNMFFGAVLGIVLSGVDGVDAWHFVGKDAVPPHLQPTPAVWVFMVIVVEFAHRRERSE